MDVSVIQQSYINYETQSNSTNSKVESTSSDFASIMQDVQTSKNESNAYAETDLLNIESYKNMTEEEKSEINTKLIEKYGEEKGKSYSIALYNASSLDDENMQNAIFDKLSNMSYKDSLDFVLDFQISLSRYSDGEKLNAGYSLNNNTSVNGDSNFDLKEYLSTISADEFESIISTLSESNKSLEKIVGGQATKFANIYDDILSSYNSYKESKNYI